ncbi:MAG: hypothetical protein QNI90_13430 [Dinoroseobacter sp.]|nr:hypothetical protein [Dinoroseobacter sp.]
MIIGFESAVVAIVVAVAFLVVSAVYYPTWFLFHLLWPSTAPDSGSELFRSYLLLLVIAGVLTSIFAVEGIVLVLVWVTLGFGGLVALVIVNLFALLVGLFPAMALSQTRFSAGAKVLSLLLITGFVTGPGFLRQGIQETAIDRTEPVAPIPVEDVRSIEFIWQDGAIAPSARGVAGLCNDLCLQLLRGGDLDWVRIVHPYLGSVRLSVEAGPGQGILAVEDDGAAADLRVTDIAEDEITTESQRFQIWHGPTRFLKRAVVDQRQQEKLVLSRLDASYRGVADYTFIAPNPDWGRTMTGVSARSFDWKLNDIAVGVPFEATLADDLAALGLTLAALPSEEVRADLLADLDESYILLALARTAQAGATADMSEAEKDAVIRLFRRLDERPAIALAESEVLKRLYTDHRGWRGKTLNDLLARAGASDTMLHAISLTDMRAALDTSDPENTSVMFDLQRLPQTQAQQVWREFDTRFDTLEVFRNLQGHGQEFILRNLGVVSDDPLPFIEVPLAIPMAEIGWPDARKRPEGVVSTAFVAARKSAPKFHPALTERIMEWLDTHATEIASRKCDRLLERAVTSLHQMGAAERVDQLLGVHGFDCTA